MDNLLATSSQIAFQLKADFVPLTVMKIHSPEPAKLDAQLAQTFRKAPNYFDQAPVILDVSELTQQQLPFDLAGICALVRERGLLPVGIRGLAEKEAALAEKNHLANMSRSQASASKPSAAPEPVEPTSNTLIIDKPIRGGSQIYAKGGDLIVLCSVNPGAEILADGSIHVYGQLHGKAIAGVKGDVNARIFCRSLDADLVSIAGYYAMDAVHKVSHKTHQTVQVYLDNKKIAINTL